MQICLKIIAGKIWEIYSVCICCFIFIHKTSRFQTLEASAFKNLDDTKLFKTLQHSVTRSSFLYFSRLQYVILSTKPHLLMSVTLLNKWIPFKLYSYGKGFG